MSGRRKLVLAAVAVLLVAAFAVAVGGGRPGRGDPAGGNGFASWLAGLAGPRDTVPATLVDAPCRQPDGSLRVAGACTLRVADPKALKLLVLRATTTFRVSAPAPGKTDATASDTVDPDEHGVAEAKVAVDKATDVVVACFCVLTIGRD